MKKSFDEFHSGSGRDMMDSIKRSMHKSFSMLIPLLLTRLSSLLAPLREVARGGKNGESWADNWQGKGCSTTGMQDFYNHGRAWAEDFDTNAIDVRTRDVKKAMSFIAQARHTCRPSRDRRPFHALTVDPGLPEHLTPMPACGRLPP